MDRKLVFIPRTTELASFQAAKRLYLRHDARLAVEDQIGHTHHSPPPVVDRIGLYLGQREPT
jgi:hypothetical protein